jgi:hypothetical protein
MRIGRRLRKLLKAELAALAVNMRGPSTDQDQLVLELQRQQNGTAALNNITLSMHSQFEEDGILLALFALLGTTNRVCVELCAGDAIESNSANLILNHGWTGILCDGDMANVRCAKRFFSRCRVTRVWPPTVACHWLSAENVNEFLINNRVPGEPDLLSIDIDGNDYWLWNAIDVIVPRVVVIEINHLWGAERSVTIPYDPRFQAQYTEHGTDYAGASLPAMVKLGRTKGYRLVAVNRIATNAFFVRNGIGEDLFPEIDPAGCFEHPRARFGREVRLPRVADREWVEV